MNILISGASGFIGRHLSRALLERGDTVFALSRSNPIAGTHHIEVTDYSPITLARALRHYQFDQVFHLAGAGSVPEDRNLLTLTKTNAVLPGVMVEATAKCRAKAFVFAGSYAEYAAPPMRELLTEAHPLENSEAYGTSKAVGSAFVLEQGEFYDLPVAVARLFNVYGPDDTLPHRLFPYLHARLAKRQEVALSAGTQCRDFVFVKDVCEAMILMADALMQKHLQPAAYNICTGQAITVADFACETANQLKVPQNLLRFGALPSRNVPDASYMIGCPKKLLETLGWTAKYDLPLGLSASI